MVGSYRREKRGERRAGKKQQSCRKRQEEVRKYGRDRRPQQAGSAPYGKVHVHMP